MLTVIDKDPRQHGCERGSGWVSRGLDGSAAGYMTIIVEAEIAPGVKVARHTHPGIETGYVLEGHGELPIQGSRRAPRSPEMLSKSRLRCRIKPPIEVKRPSSATEAFIPCTPFLQRRARREAGFRRGWRFAVLPSS